jgi:hypothetical protein
MSMLKRYISQRDEEVQCEQHSAFKAIGDIYGMAPDVQKEIAWATEQTA